MKKYIISLFVLVLLVFTAIPVFSSITSGAAYLGIIAVTDNSSAATGVSVNVTGLNSASLISQGLVNSTITNAAITYNGADVAFMPGANSTVPWWVFIPSISTGQTLNQNLYCSNVTGGKLAYFPGSGGMSTPDNNASLEPAANFTIALDAYINTDNSSTIFDHSDTTNGGIQCFSSPTGNITVQVTGVTTDTIYLYPVSAGTYTDLVPVGSAANWQCVDDPISSPDDDATYNWNYTTGKKDTFNLTSPTWLGTSQNITSVTVYFRHRRTGGATNTAQPWLRLGATDSSGTGISSTTSYVTSNQTFARPGGGSWVTGDFSTLQAGAGVGTGDGVNNERITQVYVAISYSYAILSVTGVPSGEYVTRIKADGTNLWMTVGSYTSANVSIGAGVPNSSANWTIGSNTGTPYINSWDVTIGGTLRQHIAWEYGATFHDTTSYHNDATPTFRTTTSASGVTATLTSFGPASPSVATVTPGGTNPEILTADPTAPSQLYTEGDYTKIPFGTAINQVLDVSNTPHALWWSPFIYLLIGLVGFMLSGAASGRGSRATSETALGNGSVLLQALTYELGLVLFGIMGVIPLWGAYLFPIPGLAICLSSRHWGWG